MEYNYYGGGGYHPSKRISKHHQVRAKAKNAQMARSSKAARNKQEKILLTCPHCGDTWTPGHMHWTSFVCVTCQQPVVQSAWLRSSVPSKEDEPHEKQVMCGHDTFQEIAHYARQDVEFSIQKCTWHCQAVVCLVIANGVVLETLPTEIAPYDTGNPEQEYAYYWQYDGRWNSTARIEGLTPNINEEEPHE